MPFILTTLINNTSGMEGLTAEHGLSIHISGGGKTVLFDTGAGRAFMDNARILGIDLSKLDAVVFSHGHYDHAGGVRPFFQQFPFPSLVLAGKSFSEKQYHREADGKLTYIGNTTDESWFMHKQIPFHLLDSPVYPLAENMWICTDFPRYNDFEPEYPFSRYELVLVLRSEKGLIAVCGCSHVGVVNICTALMERFDEPLYGLIGGIHLKSAGEGRIRRTVEWFKDSGIRLLGACHCTGEAAMDMLRREVPGCFSNGAGTVTVI